MSSPRSTSEQALLLDTLTPQELRVLRLLVAGHSNQEIAQELVVSLNTVKTHVKNLYSKLHVSSRTQAPSLARDLPLLKFPTASLFSPQKRVNSIPMVLWKGKIIEPR